MRPDLASQQVDSAQPGARAGDGQAEEATEYSGAHFTEYTAGYLSGSFTEYIAATGEESDIPLFSPGAFAGEPGLAAPGQDAQASDADSFRDTPVAGFQAMLSAPLGTDAPAWQATTGPLDDNGPSTAPGPTLPPDPLGGTGYRRPGRIRLLAGAAAVVILGVTGVTGTLIVMHRHAGLPTQASADSSSSPGATSTRGRAATPSPSRSATPTSGLARWTAPVPIDPQTLQGTGVRITGLSCAGPAACYAVDSAGAVLSRQSAGDWPVVTTDPQGGLLAISCASDQFCLAVDSAGYAIALSQGSWGTPGLVGTGPGTLTSVSCTGPAFCMAVDNIGYAFTYTGSAAGWTQVSVDTSGQALNSVSCASATDCVAVGATGNVFSYNGTSWSAPDAVDSGHDLVAVSCPSPAFCMAVDSAGQAAEFSGQWTLQPVGSVADAVSCPATGSCLAVDNSGAVASYLNGQWSTSAGVDTGHAISELSCRSATDCVAIDQDGSVLFYRQP
ncbi:MAG TPA: hypothetical protein VMV92_07925 [Streptosporangiaceae bacterium]|nr:hypothetical protein [Streptosporangiaceae bacterium]